ncbi:hypothetical protein BurJ1DRAFT_4552 [Burkholderiales bacterium JOSHI_001]|nr:hypothetical protein BurJ1DRAFT_4552 [Burkholderiales bacterium JOSHI_001]
MLFARVRHAAVLAAMATLALSARPALAAADGAFAIKGIGASDCSLAVREYTAGTPNAMMYGGWIYGYLTALNQLNPGTFDLAPWQDLNTLTNFVVDYCKKNPKVTFADATFKMAVALNPDRLTARTAFVRFRQNGRDFTLYATTLERMAAKLTSKGLLKTKYDSAKPAYTPDMVAAVKAFQQSRKLKATGDPDQQTLFELLQR